MWLSLPQSQFSASENGAGRLCTNCHAGPCQYMAHFRETFISFRVLSVQASYAIDASLLHTHSLLCPVNCYGLLCVTECRAHVRTWGHRVSPFEPKDTPLQLCCSFPTATRMHVHFDRRTPTFDRRAAGLSLRDAKFEIHQSTFQGSFRSGVSRLRRTAPVDCRVSHKTHLRCGESGRESAAYVAR